MEYKPQIPRCALCRHPDLEDIERRLYGGEPQQSIAEYIGCSQGTVSHHVTSCIPRRIIQTGVHPEPTVLEINCVNILTRSHDDLREIFEQAKEKGDLRSAIRALEVEIRQVHEIAVLTGQTQDAPNFNILMLPEYVSFKAQVLAAVRDIPEARERITAALIGSEGSTETIDEGLIDE